MDNLDSQDVLDSIVKAAIASGDYPGATEAIVRALNKTVRSYCLAWFRDEAFADEVAQEVFLAVHYGLKNFEWRSSVRTWVYGITRNQCLKAPRDARRFELEHSNEYEEFEKKIYYNKRTEMAEAAWNLLDKLNDVQKQIVLMRCVQGMTHQQIAEIFSVSESTIKRYWRQAIEYLKGCIEEKYL